MRTEECHESGGECEVCDYRIKAIQARGHKVPGQCHIHRRRSQLRAPELENDVTTTPGVSSPSSASSQLTQPLCTDNDMCDAPTPLLYHSFCCLGPSVRFALPIPGLSEHGRTASCTINIIRSCTLSQLVISSLRKLFTLTLSNVRRIIHKTRDGRILSFEQKLNQFQMDSLIQCQVSWVH